VSNKARAAAYRQTPEYRQSRKFYSQRPEVQLRKAIKRAMKKGGSPPTIHFAMPTVPPPIPKHRVRP